MSVETDGIGNNYDSHLAAEEKEEKGIEDKACLVKHYAMIKEEMSRTTARSVADHLLEMDLLLMGKHEEIYERKKRRDAVEEILKHVVMGNHELHKSFTDILIKLNEIPIADKLQTKRPNEEEIEKYRSFQAYSRRRCPRPNGEGPRLYFSDDEIEILAWQLKDDCVVDSLNDNLLSQFYISVKEHTSVVRYSKFVEERLKKLIETMMTCPKSLYPTFCKILDELKMSHAIYELEMHRNYCKSIKELGATELIESEACSTNKREQNDLIQMSILKLYSMIKEEMEPTATKDISNYLYSTNTMSKKDHDRIIGCRKRRLTIEILLQTVLMGGKEMQEAFKHALTFEEQQENKPHRISKKLDEVKLTDKEHKVYQAVYNGKTDTFQNISTDLLAKCRTVVNTVDSDENALIELMDKLLSRFDISIAEYVDIKNSYGGFEERLTELEVVLSRRPAEVYEDLLSMFEDLDKQNGAATSENFVHVTKLKRNESQKRKLENETLPDAKRQRVLDPKIENDIISNADSSADIKSKAEELGLEYDSSSKGSIVLKFYPKAKEWWDIIRRGCEEGTIANYSIYLLKDNEMPEGEYLFNFKLFRKLQADGKTYVVEFHWENVPNGKRI